MDTRDLVNYLGGAEFVAYKIGLKPSSVYCWFSPERNRVPGKNWSKLVELSKEIGKPITFEELDAICNPKRVPMAAE